MPVRKKILYYALMLSLTILALEGMARMAYLAAYGQWYGSSPADPPAKASGPAALDTAAEPADNWWIRHPFYGLTDQSPDHALNRMPPQQRREDAVIIALLGGSVAADLLPFFEQAVHRYFAANNLPRQPLILGLTTDSLQQPQQTIIALNTLLLDGDFDLLVNLDGFNEMAGAAGNAERGIFPFFPLWWHNRGALTAKELALVGNIQFRRQEQERLAAAGAASPWRGSALFGLLNRYRQERAAAEIIRLNQELTAAAADYSLEKYGPKSWLAGPAELRPEAARFWYRSSLTLAWLAELAGADYYHFLQPNQYVPEAKPLSAEELRWAYDTNLRHAADVEQGYPLLTLFNRELPRQGINYFDLTRIFADHPETLYVDVCCHLNDRGNELLAAAMVQRLELALQRLGRANPAGPDSLLDTAWRPAGPGPRLVNSHFQVYHQADKGRLWYIRDNCAAAEVEPRFFLHLTPRDLTDLPPYRQEHGFDNLDFSYTEAEGFFWRERCMLPVQLPDYPLAYLRTGQYGAESGELWAGDYSFPE